VARPLLGAGRKLLSNAGGGEASVFATTPIRVVDHLTEGLPQEAPRNPQREISTLRRAAARAEHRGCYGDNLAGAHSADERSSPSDWPPPAETQPPFFLATSTESPVRNERRTPGSVREGLGPKPTLVEPCSGAAAPTLTLSRSCN